MTISQDERPTAAIIPVDAAHRRNPDGMPNFADVLLSFPRFSADIARDRTPTRSRDL